MPLITWRREVQEEMLDDLPWKDGQWPSSIRPALGTVSKGNSGEKNNPFEWEGEHIVIIKAVAKHVNGTLLPVWIMIVMNWTLLLVWIKIVLNWTLLLVWIKIVLNWTLLLAKIRIILNWTVLLCQNKDPVLTGTTFSFLLQSHPACKGPEFLKAAFNINGRSPLVAHFLRMRNLTLDCNLMIRIQHTEIESLPPYPFVTLCLLFSSVNKKLKNRCLLVFYSANLSAEQKLKMLTHTIYLHIYPQAYTQSVLAEKVYVKRKILSWALNLNSGEIRQKLDWSNHSTLCFSLCIIYKYPFHCVFHSVSLDMSSHFSFVFFILHHYKMQVFIP